MAISNAKNSSNPIEMYEGRAAYRKEFPKTVIQFDTGYENRLFGKVDTLGNAVHLNDSFLTFFATKDDKKNVSCINFMADAFVESRQEYEEAVSKGFINIESPYFKEKLIVFEGWKKYPVLFQENTNSFYKNLVIFLVESSAKILEFEQFSEGLLNYIKISRMPLTRVGYFESIYNPPHTIGLVLDLFDGDAGDDALREEFVSDPNYEFVSGLLAKRGLRFDAQVPWRVIANIQSSNLRKYISPETLTGTQSKSSYLEKDYELQEIFDKYYFKSYLGVDFAAFDEFKETMKIFYTTYKDQFPKQNKLVINDRCGIKNVFIYAKPIKFKTNSREEDLFFLDLYYQIRLVETYAFYDSTKIQFHKDNYRGLYLYNKIRQKGITEALSYINYNIGTLAYRSPSLKEINLTRQGNSDSM
jgi:hypothetical protein